jgi:hypothetical protein
MVKFIVYGELHKLTGEYIMKTKFDPSTIPADKIATFNQIKLLSRVFSGEGFTKLAEGATMTGANWKQSRIIVALILEHHNNVAKKDLTHGEVQAMLEKKKLPAAYVKLFKAPENQVEAPEKKVAKKDTVVAEPTTSVEDELAGLAF